MTNLRNTCDFIKSNSSEETLSKVEVDRILLFDARDGGADLVVGGSNSEHNTILLRCLLEGVRRVGVPRGDDDLLPVLAVAAQRAGLPACGGGDGNRRRRRGGAQRPASGARQ